MTLTSRMFKFQSLVKTITRFFCPCTYQNKYQKTNLFSNQHAIILFLVIKVKREEISNVFIPCYRRNIVAINVNL